jgi:hypothetical protein
MGADEERKLECLKALRRGLLDPKITELERDGQASLLIADHIVR